MKRNKKLICFLFAIIILVLGIHCVSNIAVFEIIKLPDTVYAEISDLEYVNRSNEFGKYIDISYENEIKSTPTREITAKIKLFNLITLKEFQVKIKEETVYVPGKAIGFSLESKGLIVLGNNLITTENGKESALENSLLKKGDIILKIEGETLNSIKDMNKIINKEENKGRELKVEAIRNNKIYDTIVTPKLEKSTGTYKLGIWVKDSTNGVGTLTYIKKDNLRFGALGHPITDSDNKN
ncbi:MAG: PDZ domain-containing protein [Clostridia bacterium]|nr:PDZ domain-containing protein [Clostridia bacterium]